MIRIIEGADGTGKTTYARHLTQTLRGFYVHAEAPQADNFIDEYVRPLVELCETLEDTPIVADRWHLGELVWPRLFMRGSLFPTPESFDICCRLLADLGATLELVVRDPVEIRRTIIERGESEKDAMLAISAQTMFIEALPRVRYIPTTIVHSDVLHEEVQWKSA